MLNADEVRLLIDLLGDRTVVEPRKDFPFRVVQPNPGGYHPDRKRGALQAKLSILLETAVHRETARG